MCGRPTASSRKARSKIDLFAHALTGLALAGAGSRKKIGVTAYPLLVAASLLPDSDIFLRVFGSDAFLFGHRGLTHSIAGLAFQAILLALAFRSFAPAVSAGILAGYSALGLGVHAAMDCLTSWGPMLLAPFSRARFSLDWIPEMDAVFIAVPAIAFAAGLARAQRRERYSRAAFGVLLAYVSVCAGSHAMGCEQVKAAMAKIGIKPDRVEAYPTTLDPLGWNGVAWTADRYFQVGVGTFSGVHGRVRSYFRVSMPPGLKSGFTDGYIECARAPMLRFTAGRYPNEAILCDLRFVVPGGRAGYAAVITSSVAGTTRRWMDWDESIPDPDMEFELPNK